MNFFVGMKQLFISLALAAVMAGLPGVAFAQEQNSQKAEDAEKKMQEYIDKEVERLTISLGLEYWQEFYADSTLNHDIRALQDEYNALSAAKVANRDLYTAAQDKWQERTYESFHRFLNEKQWAKYLKSGAAREQKARDKRKQKAAGGNKK